MTESPADKPLLAVLRGDACSPPPIWLMRQAGRYLPEYRALRAEKGSFLALCYDPEAAAEVTLQPLARFAFDGAILFSDILVVPQLLGQDLTFTTGEGPRLSPPLAEAKVEDLVGRPDHLAPIYETVRRVRQRLPRNATLIGFAGAPWTVATYMVEGQGSRNHEQARLQAYQQPGRFQALLDRLIDATTTHLARQADAGAEALMLFDSWAGALSPAQFETLVIRPTATIVARLRQTHPGVPIIGFPKGAHEKLPAYVRETGVDAVGLDESVDPFWAARNLPDDVALQGNIDPMALLAGGEALRDAVRRLRDAMAGRHHILNLGHGINRHTPIPHVEELVALVRGENT